MIEYPFPAGRQVERFDQSKWRIFPLRRGAVVVTASGQKLFEEQPAFRSLLRDYRTDIRNQGHTSPMQRQYFNHGGNSDVYTVGSTPLVVKETSTDHSTWLALDRMDYLYNICNTDLPPHVRVPEHYGAIFSGELKKQYLLMRKANDGVTVEDVKDSPTHQNDTKAMVAAEFGKLKKLLDNAINKFKEKTGLQKNLLPDWHEGNVIVDFSTSTQKVPFTFWIIDQ